MCRTLAGPSLGSGYDFVRGVRDLDWELANEPLARRAASLLSWVRGVKVRIQGPEDTTSKKFGRTRPLRRKGGAAKK